MRALASVATLTACPLLLWAASATATTVYRIDEFSIVKNGAEIFRDSFSDGIAPPDGPDGPSTYFVRGAGGITAESGGKLDIAPALGGVPTNIVGTNFFTGVTRRSTTRPGLFRSLEFADSFSVSGLFDLSNLPQLPGDNVGIRVSDIRGPDTANDSIQLSVSKSTITGALGIRLAKLDFVVDTIDVADFVPIADLLADNPTATQIELTLFKAASSDVVDGEFALFDGSSTQLGPTHALSNISSTTNSPLTIYHGETFTRARFYGIAGVSVPEPTTLTLLGLGLAGMGYTRRRSKRLH